MTAELIQAYRAKMPIATIAMMIRGFKFDEGYAGFHMENLKMLRMRLAYLFWVSLHSGPVDYVLRKIFLNMHREKGTYGCNPGEEREK